MVACDRPAVARARLCWLCRTGHAFARHADVGERAIEPAIAAVADLLT